jgi:adenosine kinase
MEETSSQPILFGMGNVFIDCYANADQELLDKYGLTFGLPGELTEDQIPVLKDLEAKEGYHEMTGGSAINTLRAVNFLMKKEEQKEHTTLFFASIAKDEKGQTIKNCLDEDGVIYKFNEHDSGHTGQCAIIIVKGERTPVSNSGVNNKFETSHFTDNIDLLAPCRLLYVEGFFVSSNFEAIAACSKYALENNKTFAFNLCGEFWIEKYSDKFIEILPYCDLLFGNLNEFKSLAKILDIQYENPEDLVKQFAT